MSVKIEDTRYVKNIGSRVVWRGGSPDESEIPSYRLREAIKQVEKDGMTRKIDNLIISPEEE